MKINDLFFMLPLLALAVSCDDRTGAENPDTDAVFSYWEQPHSAMAGLAGDVKSVIEYTVEEDLRFPLSYMVFNEDGNIRSYDPTGMTVPESFITGEAGLMSKSAPATKAGFFATSRYEFGYDASGRISSVREYDMLPDPVAEYAFEYGEGGVYAPLDITGTGVSLVPGVVSVKAGFSGDGPDPEASVSFLFEVRDGGAYTYSMENSYGMVAVRESEITYRNGLPVSESAVYYEGSEENTEKTADETVTYTWDEEKGILLSSVAEKKDLYGSVSKTEDKYSSKFPMKKTESRTFADGTLQTELLYTYDEKGNLLESAYTEGYEGFGSDMKIEYKAFDGSGNWTECLQTSADGEYYIYRAITYR